VRRSTLFAGTIITPAAREVNKSTLVVAGLDLIGTTGFVITFALQNTLSNFSGGIMIMLYTSFDTEGISNS
jgi:small-conductance mechanosensitive channel